MTSSRYITAALLLATRLTAQATTKPLPTVSTTVGNGWASSSVNAVIFRTNSIVTHGNTQYTAYYDDSSRVVLAKRNAGSRTWQLHTTAYTNDVSDAHNAIAIAVDGEGTLHVAWAEHAKTLHYARGVAPGLLELGAPTAMTSQHETRVTYPQFYSIAGGDLLFIYRDGQSGRGDIMLNRWVTKQHTWRAIAHPLISGEGERNAYMNLMATDAKGGLHLSWVWRESGDVATNHDILYAFSADTGRSWQTSRRQLYALPITAKTAELAWSVAQNHELINQTSMTVDASGHPLIATYWRADDSDVPQFQLVWNDGTHWLHNQIGARAQPFRLSGGGTKRIPISRPLIIAGPANAVHVIFRDEERGGVISVATARDKSHATWNISALTSERVGQWEPTHDAIAWQQTHRLHLFVQRVAQGDAESLERMDAQPVSILEWKP